MREDLYVVANDIIIEVEGCDDSTVVVIKNATVGAVKSFEKLSAMINVTSLCGCMPRMYVRSGSQDDLSERDCAKVFNWQTGEEIKTE